MKNPPTRWEVWHPLWKNVHAQIVSIPEREALYRITQAIDVPYLFIETILTIDNIKALRVRIHQGIECNIDLYEYHIFAPVFMNQNQLCWQESAIIRLHDMEDRTVSRVALVDEKRLTARIMGLFSSAQKAFAIRSVINGMKGFARKALLEIKL